MITKTTTLHLLFNHHLTDEQTADAKNSLGVTHIKPLPDDLQQRWSNIPPENDTLDEYLNPIMDYLAKALQTGDIVLVQGDFGATWKIVNYLKKIHYKAVYATTKREVIEQQEDNKTLKKSVFKHIRFREY